jgi:hypothetical protein
VNRSAEAGGVLDRLFFIVNSGWFGALSGFILFIIALIISIVMYYKSKPNPRLRKSLAISVLIGVKQPSVLSALEIRFNGVVVPRVTSASVGVWNDGTTTFRGDDIVSSDHLRLVCNNGGELLEVSVSSVTRPVNGVVIGMQSNQEAEIIFDYLDPGDAFRVTVIHSGGRKDLEILGTIRGLRSGLSERKGGFLYNAFSKVMAILWVGIMVALFSQMAKSLITNGHGWVLILPFIIGPLIVIFVVWIGKGKPDRIRGVPSVITEDALLYRSLL